ncbi:MULTISPECIES: TerD family protein [unclassified Nocardioides]|uniref:TerD family protein n=1 Tax=unclassified Nocardioides TaxID=2615069 RepID=UPI0009EFA797|nr:MULTISPECIES: TerD family protein [unclassified Nocardioides]GAW51129.1 stress protein [Nocardioides sp. PD653-B2]GAW57528.1 stress protein [Nocardioides sp. PD653]
MIELTPGQELALTTGDGRPLTRLTMGVGWRKIATAGAIGTGAPDVDLDASAVQFAGDQLFDLAFYNNLRTRDGSVVHLGDNQTGRGEGDDEAITVDLTQVYAKVDTIVFMVSSYQGHTLEWISRSYCRLVGDDDVEIARVNLFGGPSQTGLVLAKLVRDGDHWTLEAIGQGIDAKIPTEAVAALRRFL